MRIAPKTLLAATISLPIAASCSPPPEASPVAEPHPEEAAAVAAAEQPFEAMRVGDSEMAHAVFHPDARLGRAGEDGISFRSADGFIEMIGSPRDEVYDEPVWDWTVQIDGRLAQMWTRYAFYREDTFSHCGWEGFQLYRADAGWQITQLIDTSYRENCWYPPGREPAQTPAEDEPGETSEGP